MFDLLVVGSIGAIVLCFFLPASIEKKRDSYTVAEPVVSAVNTTNVVISEQDSSTDEEDAQL